MSGIIPVNGCSRGKFDFLIYGSSVAELRSYLEEANAYDDTRDEAMAGREAALAARVEQIMQAAGREARVAYHEKGRIARLMPVYETQ